MPVWPSRHVSTTASLCLSRPFPICTRQGSSADGCSLLCISISYKSYYWQRYRNTLAGRGYLTPRGSSTSLATRVPLLVTTCGSSSCLSGGPADIYEARRVIPKFSFSVHSLSCAQVHNPTHSFRFIPLFHSHAGRRWSSVYSISQSLFANYIQTSRS